MPKHKPEPQGKSHIAAASLGGGSRTSSGAPPPGGLNSRSSPQSPGTRTCPTPPPWSTRTSSRLQPTFSGFSSSEVGFQNRELIEMMDNYLIFISLWLFNNSDVIFQNGRGCKGGDDTNQTSSRWFVLHLHVCCYVTTHYRNIHQINLNLSKL